MIGMPISFETLSLLFLLFCCIVLRYAVPSYIGKWVLGATFLANWAIIAIMYYDSVK